MIIIEEHNSAANTFYTNLKQTHEKNYLSCTQPIIDKYWEEDEARRARDTKMGIIHKRSKLDEKNLARHKKEWERWENRANYEAMYEATRAVPQPTEEYRLRMNEYKDADTDDDNARTIQRKKHTKPCGKLSVIPTVSVGPKPKPCTSNSEYLRWYNGVKTGTIVYNPFVAKPYIDFVKGL
jgi:hypothetical protein